jgi:hypothetical protein
MKGSGSGLFGEMWPQMLRTRMGLLDRRAVAETSVVDLLLLAGMQYMYVIVIALLVCVCMCVSLCVRVLLLNLGSTVK